MIDGAIILGIDPGSLRTGFGLISWSQNRVAHVAHGTIVLDGKKALSDRLRDLALDLTSIIKKYNPHHVAVEDVFLYTNPRSALVLGQARGAALAVLGLHGLPIQSLAPTRVKSLIVGKGHAQKFQVARFVALELNISEPKSNDASDALALAMACAYLHR